MLDIQHEKIALLSFSYLDRIQMVKSLLYLKGLYSLFLSLIWKGEE